MSNQAVLVVDDQPNIRKLVAYNVEKMGYESDRQMMDTTASR